MPPSDAICRAHRSIDGLCGWRMRSHAYFMLCRNQKEDGRSSIVIFGKDDCSSSTLSGCEPELQRGNDNVLLGK
ncbi:hypothetical protein LOK49_LG07G01099 [Camellia lanceoleosa]|uniref:Uncharacterized protein n=1 Tax=Camellia lanceoleosa TaxID=1840588 RepID=A0ACC0H0Z2_9ERIC|nr:hypothetical protein LOK49_LG07G01099 [Camellia lanceoleosa]